MWYHLTFYKHLAAFDPCFSRIEYFIFTRYLKILRFKTAESEGKTIHVNQKPIALLEYLIKTYTKEGDTVLDFASGSMSTAIACIYTNRKCICIEKDETYFSQGEKRVRNEYQYL